MVNLPESKKPGRSNPYHISVESWRYYADKVGAELFILDRRIFTEDIMNANWHKVYALDLLNANDIDFGKVVIVDSDTIIHPDAPNIFELVGDKFYAVHNSGSYDWLLRSYENYSKLLFDGFEFDFTKYFNSGFIIVNKRHQKFYKKVQIFYHDNRDKIQAMQDKLHVGTDQPVLNFMVHKYIPNEFELLPYEWNMQDLTRREILDTELTFTNYGWVYHFNALRPEFKLDKRSDKSVVYQWMEYTYYKLLKDK